MSHHLNASEKPLSWWLFSMFKRPEKWPEMERVDSRPDSIVAPSEAPEDHPEWLGFTPEIQKLLR